MYMTMRVPTCVYIESQHLFVTVQAMSSIIIELHVIIVQVSHLLYMREFSNVNISILKIIFTLVHCL